MAQAPSREECGLPRDALVFCCFNYSYKITPQVFDIWMRLLGAIPDSVLWLLNSTAEASANLRAQALRRNVTPERIIFAPRLDQARHLARIGLADLFLDTFPVTAHTTASDALWAGCPIVTCAGTTFVSRVAGSILRAAGMPDLVASSFDEYEAIILGLASNRAELASLKVRLRENRSKCRLFDASATTRAIESAYERMWEIYRTGQPPQSFAVPSEPAGNPSYASTLPNTFGRSESLPAF
jgi:predicted O-linked N-acetylglucosamine transferase (SPINDLY family)